MTWFRRSRKQPPGNGNADVEHVITSELVVAAAREHLPRGWEDRVRQLLRPSLRLVPTTTDGAVARLGGPAILPNEAEWPTWQDRPLEVIAVVNVGQMPRMEGLDLPNDGWLTFFYDARDQSAWGFDPSERDAWRVIHSTSETIVAPPAGAESFPEVWLTAREELTYPDPWEEELQELQEKHPDQLFAFAEALPEVREPAHRLGGWPDLVQNPPWVGAQLASHGLYVGNPSGYTDPRAAALWPGAKDWQLLMQIDSDDSADMMWGDVGRLYYLMRTDDLRQGDFSQCWFDLQCS